MKDPDESVVPLLNDLEIERSTSGVLGGRIDRRVFLGICGKCTCGIFLTGCLGSLVSCEQDRGGSDYYLKQKDQLLGEAREFSEAYKLVMTPEYGQGEAKAIADGMVVKFDEIIDELPYIGGDQTPLIAHTTGMLIHAQMIIAFCLVMKEHGLSIDDAGRINYETMQHLMQAEAGQPVQKFAKGEIEKKRQEMEEFAKWTQKREYSCNWVSFFVGDVHEPFIYGWDNTECGNLKLCNYYGIGEFTNYLCMLDQIVYASTGQGLSRSMTLADNYRICDFRLRNDGIVDLKEPFTVKKLREWGK